MLGEKPISTGLLSKKGGSEGNRLAVPNKAGAGGSSRLTAAGPAVGGRGRGRRSADWVRALLAGGPPAANAGTDVRGRGSHGDAPPPTGQAGPTTVPIETRPTAASRRTGGLALVGAKLCPGYSACAIGRRIVRASSACPSGLPRGTRASCAPALSGDLSFCSPCHEVPSICCL